MAEERASGLPEPYRGYDAGHRYIYSTEDGDSCSCGWQPSRFRTTSEEWTAHLDDAGIDAYAIVARRPLMPNSPQ